MREADVLRAGEVDQLQMVNVVHCRLHRRVQRRLRRLLPVHVQRLRNSTALHHHQQAVRVATQYAPAPRKFTIISFKYENCQRLQFTAEFAKRQTITTRKISTVLFYQVCADTNRNLCCEVLLSTG